jgi:urease accessory protein UreF
VAATLSGAKTPRKPFISYLQLLLLAFRRAGVHGKTDPAGPPFGEVAVPADRMVEQTQLALSDAAEWLGDWHPLADQLGSADGLASLGSVSSFLCLTPVHNVPSLRRFLEHYQAQVLLPFELPAIQRAHGLAACQQVRELVALDQQLATQPTLQTFAAASQRVGRSQLQKLRPLRDVRVVQRYLHAVESGEAHGWHTLVYGLTLAVYSLPLRQGLLGYAHQTTRGFIYSAARMLHLSERQCRDLFNDLCANLPEALAPLLVQPAVA